MASQIVNTRFVDLPTGFFKSPARPLLERGAQVEPTEGNHESANFSGTNTSAAQQPELRDMLLRRLSATVVLECRSTQQWKVQGARRSTFDALARCEPSRWASELGAGQRILLAVPFHAIQERLGNVIWVTTTGQTT